MRKINKIDALIYATKAVRNDDIVLANNIIKVVDRSITRDKNNRDYSDHIILKREEKKLFIE